MGWIKHHQKVEDCPARFDYQRVPNKKSMKIHENAIAISDNLMKIIIKSIQQIFCCEQEGGYQSFDKRPHNHTNYTLDLEVSPAGFLGDNCG
jgi:hypothetical protein